MSKAGPDGGGRREGESTPTCAAWGLPPSGAISWICVSVRDLQEFHKSKKRFKSDNETVIELPGRMNDE